MTSSYSIDALMLKTLGIDENGVKLFGCNVITVELADGHAIGLIKLFQLRYCWCSLNF